MKPSEWLWQYIVGWNSNTSGSKVYPPIMCITFPGYISVVSLFFGNASLLFPLIRPRKVIHILIMHHYTYIIQSNLTDLHTCVNNKFFHACKCKVISCGNVTSHENAMSCGSATSGNSIMVSWKIISLANFGILHVKYRMLPHV